MDGTSDDTRSQAKVLQLPITDFMKKVLLTYLWCTRRESVVQSRTGPEPDGVPPLCKRRWAGVPASVRNVDPVRPTLGAKTVRVYSVYGLRPNQDQVKKCSKYFLIQSKYLL